MTEVDRDTEKVLQPFVVLPEDIIVGRHRAPLGVASLDMETRSFDVRDGYREYLFYERNSNLPISKREQDAMPVLSRDDEVSLRIADPSSTIDDRWPYINEFAVCEVGYFLPSSPPVLVSSLFLSGHLNLPSIHTLQKPENRVSGYRGE